MNEKLDEQADEAMEKDGSDNFNKPQSINVGVETEFPLWTKEGEPVDQKTRDQLAKEFENVDIELGATQIEIGTDPVIGLEKISDIEEAIWNVEAPLREEAEDQGVILGRYGTNPTVPLDDIQRSDKEKYIRVPNVYGKLRNADVQEVFGKNETIDPRNEGIPALLTSTQLNIQADDLEGAVEKCNIGYAVAPYVTALSANSRVLDGKDLGFDDIRMLLWETSFDVRENWDEEPDVGRLDSYIEDFDDYIDRVRKQPRIMNDEKYQEEALDVAEGMFWKDFRIKVMEDGELSDNILVESRQQSTQPSPAEDAAVHGFIVGRLVYAQNKGEIEDEATGPEELMDIEKVNRNRYISMHNGMDGKMYNWDGELEQPEDVLSEEIEKARKGLDYVNVDDSMYLDILENRLVSNMTPSEEMIERCAESQDPAWNVISNLRDYTAQKQRFGTKYT